MLVTLSGIVILSRLSHSLNAYMPIEVTPLPMVRLLRFLQYENALLPMLVTLLGIVTLLSNWRFVFMRR